MESLSRFSPRTTDFEYRCTHDLHLGEDPGKWKINHKCIPLHCPWLLTKAAFDKWCRENNVHFVGD